MLEVRDIRKSFNGFAAVAGISLGVPAQGITAVIGPNGAGKSTLFNLLTGHLHARRAAANHDDVEFLLLRHADRAVVRDRRLAATGGRLARASARRGPRASRPPAQLSSRSS